MKVATEDLKEGYELPSVSKAVILDKMKVFSAWSGRSIHTDGEVAKKFGLPGVPAQGLVVYAYLVEILVKFFGSDWLTGGKIDVAYTKPIFVGDTISTKAIVQSKQIEDTGIRVAIDVSCENQNGETVAAGTASVLAHG